MAIGRLYAYIKTSEAGDKLIVLLMLLMRDKELQKKKIWRSLSQSFFKKYRSRILEFCGYGKNRLGVDKIGVAKEYRNLFLTCIGCLIRSGVIADCSYSKMAKLLEEFFDVGHTKNTILNKLKDENPDFEELKNMIYSEKKRMKSKREIENK